MNPWRLLTIADLYLDVFNFGSVVGILVILRPSSFTLVSTGRNSSRTSTSRTRWVSWWPWFPHVPTIWHATSHELPTGWIMNIIIKKTPGLDLLNSIHFSKSHFLRPLFFHWDGRRSNFRPVTVPVELRLSKPGIDLLDESALLGCDRLAQYGAHDHGVQLPGRWVSSWSIGQYWSITWKIGDSGAHTLGTKGHRAPGPTLHGHHIHIWYYLISLKFWTCKMNKNELNELTPICFLLQHPPKKHW